MGHLLDEPRPDWIRISDDLYKDIEQPNYREARVDIGHKQSYPCIVKKPNGLIYRFRSTRAAAKEIGEFAQNLGMYLRRDGKYLARDKSIVTWEAI